MAKIYEGLEECPNASLRSLTTINNNDFDPKWKSESYPIKNGKEK